MEQNSNPGFVLIGLSGTGSISWTNLKMIKTDRNGSLAVQLYSFIIIFFLCDFKFLVRHEAAIFSSRSFYFANVMFYSK